MATLSGVTAIALAHLQAASDDLHAAYAEIMLAGPRLFGARQARVAELVAHLDEVINDMDRLVVITEGDLRAGQ
jgi:hypothetical protein